MIDGDTITKTTARSVERREPEGSLPRFGVEGAGNRGLATERTAAGAVPRGGGVGWECGDLAVDLLAGLRIRRQGRILAHPFPTRKTASLFAFLLLHPGRTFARDYLAGIFWPDADPDAARASLRTAVVPIRRLLEPRPDDRGCFLVATHTTLGVTPPPDCDVDVWAFERWLGEAERLLAGAPEWFRALETAVRLYGGDLLPDLEETWAWTPREGLRQRLLTALHDLARADLDRNQYARATEWARRALAVDPCDEESHRRLMLLHARLGQHAGVVRQFHECRRVLREELETIPETQTLALFEELQARARPEWPLPGRREGLVLSSRS